MLTAVLVDYEVVAATITAIAATGRARFRGTCRYTHDLTFQAGKLCGCDAVTDRVQATIFPFDGTGCQPTRQAYERPQFGWKGIFDAVIEAIRRTSNALLRRAGDVAHDLHYHQSFFERQVESHAGGLLHLYRLVDGNGFGLKIDLHRVTRRYAGGSL